MVGYVNEKDGYRVQVLSKNKIECSHDVLFKSEAVGSTNSIFGHADKNLKNRISKAKEDTKYEIPAEDFNEVERVIEGSNVPNEKNFAEEENFGLRRSNRNKNPPKWMASDDFVLLVDSLNCENDPQSYIDAAQSPQKEE